MRSCCWKAVSLSESWQFWAVDKDNCPTGAPEWISIDRNSSLILFHFEYLVLYETQGNISFLGSGEGLQSVENPNLQVWSCLCAVAAAHSAGGSTDATLQRELLGGFPGGGHHAGQTRPPLPATPPALEGAASVWDCGPLLTLLAAGA